MNDHKTKKKSCQRCEKKTEHENSSEGFAGVIYYEDWCCVDCGAYTLIPKKGEPKFETEYCISTGSY